MSPTNGAISLTIFLPQVACRKLCQLLPIRRPRPCQPGDRSCQVRPGLRRPGGMFQLHLEEWNLVWIWWIPTSAENFPDNLYTLNFIQKLQTNSNLAFFYFSYESFYALYPGGIRPHDTKRIMSAGICDTSRAPCKFFLCKIRPKRIYQIDPSYLMNGKIDKSGAVFVDDVSVVCGFIASRL
jgi:hypothetical protein